MEVALKAELRKEISRIVDLMIQGEAIRESINELKKDINKTNVDLAATNKILDNHQISIDEIIKSNSSSADVDKLDPNKK